MIIIGLDLTVVGAHLSGVRIGRVAVRSVALLSRQVALHLLNVIGERLVVLLCGGVAVERPYVASQLVLILLRLLGLLLGRLGGCLRISLLLSDCLSVRLLRCRSTCLSGCCV